MKTDELMDLLAREAAPVQPARPALRLAAAGSVGLLLSLPVVVGLMGLNPALGADLNTGMFWVKLGVPLAVLLSAAALCGRLALPGRLLGWTAAGPLLPIAALAVLALIALGSAKPGERADLVLGSTWTVCAINIAALALPTLVLSLVALRSLAPTRLRLAGASAGLLAGAAGALVYSLHCPELAAPFLAVWYVIGMAVPALVGAALGPRLLRW